MEDPVVRFLVEFASGLEFDFEPCMIFFAILAEHTYLIPPLLLFSYFCFRGAKCFIKHRKKGQAYAG